jgi:hypothetical protein
MTGRANAGGSGGAGIIAPLDIIFDPTPEIFATDGNGSFGYSLLMDGKSHIDVQAFDEVRFVFSVWHPSSQRSIDLDKAYLELRGAFDPQEDHWTRIAEIEPVVPAYGAGDSFDGWIVLPVLSSVGAFALFGSGFEPRARVQVRASAYFVA